MNLMFGKPVNLRISRKFYFVMVRCKSVKIASTLLKKLIPSSGLCPSITVLCLYFVISSFKKPLQLTNKAFVTANNLLIWSFNEFQCT